jgi:hypothetical protein
MIAGMYLITRPFKIGDKITIFRNTGTVTDIGLLYCVLLMKDGDIIRAPSSLLLTTSIILREKKPTNIYADWYILNYQLCIELHNILAISVSMREDICHLGLHYKKELHIYVAC